MYLLSLAMNRRQRLHTRPIALWIKRFAKPRPVRCEAIEHDLKNFMMICIELKEKNIKRREG